jgi:UDP-2-acetamido-3-amino-2,3-dideoxy-glucuronate N-acetyltransferase
MSTSKTLSSSIPRVVVIGSGYWGKHLVRNFQSLDALAGICDNNDETLRQFAEQYPDRRMYRSFGEVLADPSVPAVAIATPAETHANLVREALLAGKDVCVEKPLCLSVETGESLVALAKAEGRILMVGHLLWYHPAVLRLKELIDNGELGRIQYIYSNRLNLGKIRREENILWSFAPHDISVILGLLGEMPDAVHAQGGNYLHQRIADVTVSLLSFPSGVKAHVFVSWLHPFKEQKLIVVGDRKMAVFDDLEKQDKLILYPHSIEWKCQLPVPNKAEGQAVPLDGLEPLRAECRHFLECVTTRRTPRTDGDEGLRVLRVLQRCQGSLDVRPFLSSGTQEPPGRRAPNQRPYFAHESAFVDEHVEIGDGTSIWHVSHILKGTRIGKQCKIGQNVVIGPNVVIGNGVKIQNNVSVYEGVTLENGVFCGPSMVFTNVFNPRSEVPRMNELRPTLVKQGATLGANCTIVCGHTIGRYAFVGAGAVVTKDVPDHALIIGTPGRLVGWMCRCGVKLKTKGVCLYCAACGTRYRKAATGLTLLTVDSTRIKKSVA